MRLAALPKGTCIGAAARRTRDEADQQKTAGVAQSSCWDASTESRRKRSLGGKTAGLFGTKQRVAYELMLNVGTARVDTHLITWVQADADEFEYTRRGATAHEIMAALGHLTLAEAERYTREADRRRGGGGGEQS